MFSKHALILLSLLIIGCSPSLEKLEKSNPQDVHLTLPDALAEEVTMFEAYLETQPAFSHLAQVKINTLSVRPLQSDSQVCLSLSYLSHEEVRSETAPVCYLFQGDMELHFSFTQIFSQSKQRITHKGESFNDKSLDIQLDIMLSLYDRGLYQMATQAI